MEESHDVRYVLTVPRKGENPGKIEELLAYLKTEFESNHLIACVDRELDNHDKCKADRFLVVTASPEDIKREAESLKIHKLKKLQKGSKHPDLEEYEAESTQFTDFTSGEKCDILWDMIEMIEMNENAYKHMEDSHSFKYAKGSRSLILGLKMAGVIDICTPLHENNQKRDIWRSAYKKIFTPVEEISGYFGSEIAFYFAWMNFSTVWYIFPGIAGLAVYLYGKFSDHTVDDNPYIPVFSFFVVMWAVMFIKYWIRHQNMWAYKFCTISDEESEIERAEFEGTLVKSEVTGKEERYYPYRKRLVSYLFSTLVTGFMLCIAFAVMCCSLNFQGYIDHDTTYEKFFYIQAIAKYAEEGALFDPMGSNLLLTLVPTILHVVTIMQLNAIYRGVAEWLTDAENHRTAHEHENALIIKRVFFEAFDCYIALFYIAFFQFDVSRLRVELVQMYTTDSIRRIGVESLLPILLNVVWRVTNKQGLKVATPLGKIGKTQSKHKTLKVLSALEIELEIQGMAEYEQFDDYLEMVIQFGYVTLFASAFPLAAALSFFCNLIEMKSDLFKLVWVYRRPPAMRASNIGTWLAVMKTMVAMSILTNCMIFTFSSEQMMQWLPFMFIEVDGDQAFAPEWAPVGYSLCYTLEHFLIVLAVIMFFAIPDTPHWVITKLAKLKHHHEMLAHKARKEVRDKAKIRLATYKSADMAKAKRVGSPPTLKSSPKATHETATTTHTDPPVEDVNDGFQVVQKPRRRKNKNAATKAVLESIM